MLIPREVFQLAALAKALNGHDEIAGIHLERLKEGRCAATATSGKALISTSWDDVNDEEYPVVEGGCRATKKEKFSAILPVAAAAEIQKAIPRAPMKPILEYAALDEEKAGEVLTLSTTDLDSTRHFTPRGLDGNFPTLVKVLANAKLPKHPAMMVKIDPRRLKELCAILERMHPAEPSRRGNPPNPIEMTMEVYAPDKPVVFKLASSGLDTVALVMPIVKG